MKLFCKDCKKTYFTFIRNSDEIKMKSLYKVSFINYHFVFCPKYRKKIFSNEDLELEFKKLTKEICNELKIQIIAMECL